MNAHLCGVGVKVMKGQPDTSDVKYVFKKYVFKKALRSSITLKVK